MKQNIKSLTILLAALPAASSARESAPKPQIQTQGQLNVLVILTDQLAEHMLFTDGNRNVSTPAMDRLVAEGVRLNRCYVTNPVSIPSRFSLMTGRYPSVVGMESNGGIRNAVPDSLRLQSLAFRFREAGYQTLYTGKKHLTGATPETGYESPEAYGFDYHLASRDNEGREPSTQAVVDFLNDRKNNKQPFLFLVSLINPHDICYYPLNQAGVAEGKPAMEPTRPMMQIINGVMPPESLTDDFVENQTPALPKNFAPTVGEVPGSWITNGYIGWARTNYTERDWRIYRYLYDRLIEVVDNQIGRIMDALRTSGMDQNTIVILTSDHGEMNGAHRMSTKGVMYEESARVPLLVRWKGTLPEGKTVDALVSSGLDLLPTLYELTGVRTGNTPGRSLVPLLKGQKSPWRETLMVEGDRERMVIFDGMWKYVVTCPKRGRQQYEMLFDLKNDPGETTNIASKNKAQLAKGRRALADFCRSHGLKLDADYIVK